MKVVAGVETLIALDEAPDKIFLKYPNSEKWVALFRELAEKVLLVERGANGSKVWMAALRYGKKGEEKIVPLTLPESNDKAGHQLAAAFVAGQFHLPIEAMVVK